MATSRSASTHWEGNLVQGTGEVTFASSKVGSFPVSWPSRAEQANGKTSPEELIAAAHSACYSMALSNALSEAGHAPDHLDVTAVVGFQPGTGITGSEITVSAQVPGITPDEFKTFAEDAKKNCPVSQALAGIPITLTIK